MQNDLKRRKLAKVFVLSSAIGGVELVLDGGSAEAAVVTGNFNRVNQTTTFSITITGTPGGGTVKARLDAATRFSWSYQTPGTLKAALTAASDSNDFSLLNTGAVVGVARDFYDYGDLPNNFDGFIGFSFEDASSNVYYGYVRAMGNADGTLLSLTNYAYESIPGMSITVVPEPPPHYSLGLLALGAAGVSLYRKRKQGEGPQVSA